MIFKDEIIKHYHEKKEYMKKKVMDKLSENNEKELIQTVVYGMRFEIDYNMLDIISCMNMDMATGPKQVGTQRGEIGRHVHMIFPNDDNYMKMGIIYQQNTSFVDKIEIENEINTVTIVQ